MGTINTGSFAKALWPGIKAWYGETYNSWSKEYPELFEIQTSEKAFEEMVGVSQFGLFQEKTEGSGVSYDEARQGFIDRAVNKTFALGFIVTEEAMEDNQYNLASLGRDDARGLARSMNVTMETLAANVYNRAFNSSYTFGDGVELCSLLHPNIAGGTYANELAVAADLSEAALEQACIDIEGFTDDRGLTIAAKPTRLILPRQLRFEAERILKSVGQNDTANNAINALRSTGVFKNGFTVNHYLTDPDAWFIRTDVMKGMTMFNRRSPKFGMDDDFSTSNAMFKASFRASWTCGDKRGIFGSPGA